MNTFVFSSMAMVAVLFCMLAAHDIAGVASFAVFYGLFSGTCEHYVIFQSNTFLIDFTDVTLMAPVLSLLAENPNEIGYAFV